MSLVKEPLLSRITGRGLEIGAYHSPLPVPPEASVRYVDLYSSEDAAIFSPEGSAGREVVRPDILTSADDLSMLPDASEDFILASHLLEHLPDPISALKEWHRVLRRDGLLLLVLPDKRCTFDRFRQRTSLDHLVADYRDPPDSDARRARDRDHYRDWARRVNGLTSNDHVEFWARLLERSAFPIHFHCWILEDLRELMGWLDGNEGLRYTLEGEAEEPGCFEFALLLRAEKEADRAAPPRRADTEAQPTPPTQTELTQSEASSTEVSSQ